MKEIGETSCQRKNVLPIDEYEVGVNGNEEVEKDFGTAYCGIEVDKKIKIEEEIDI